VGSGTGGGAPGPPGAGAAQAGDHGAADKKRDGGVVDRPGWSAAGAFAGDERAERIDVQRGGGLGNDAAGRGGGGSAGGDLGPAEERGGIKRDRPGGGGSAAR